MKAQTLAIASLAAIILGPRWARAVTIETIGVANPGNAADTRYGTPGYGAVAYTYTLGRYEVTNAQYSQFLNAVAVTDPHDLYNPEMDGEYGGITRLGPPGACSYALKSGWYSRPVNYVSFYDCLRFANWLHNGQPAGAQDASTTEDGAYDLSLGQAVTRKPGARVFLPSEDEWYKAAYFKKGGTSAAYWTYPTQSDTAPVAEPPPGGSEPPGSANYDMALPGTYPTNVVGAYTLSPGPYNTFDQAGNIFEWNEADIDGTGTYRGLRGGSWQDGAVYLEAGCRGSNFAPSETNYFGFRVAGALIPGDAQRDGDVDFADYQILETHFGMTAGAFWAYGDFDGDYDVDFADYQELEEHFSQHIPEPATLSLLALGGLSLLKRMRKP